MTSKHWTVKFLLMKVWLKTLLAAFAGIILSLIIKQQEPSLPEFFLPISQTAIQLGRYAIFPLIFREGHVLRDTRC